MSDKNHRTNPLSFPREGGRKRERNFEANVMWNREVAAVAGILRKFQWRYSDMDRDAVNRIDSAVTALAGTLDASDRQRRMLVDAWTKELDKQQRATESRTVSYARKIRRRGSVTRTCTLPP